MHQPAALEEPAVQTEYPSSSESTTSHPQSNSPGPGRRRATAATTWSWLNVWCSQLRGAKPPGAGRQSHVISPTPPPRPSHHMELPQPCPPLDAATTRPPLACSLSQAQRLAGPRKCTPAGGVCSRRNTGRPRALPQAYLPVPLPPYGHRPPRTHSTGHPMPSAVQAPPLPQPQPLTHSTGRPTPLAEQAPPVPPP